MPIQLTIIAIIEVENSREAERELHQHFVEKRLRGEWFALNEQDVELIKGFPDSFAALADEGIPF
jgi:hypothetical protein